MLEGTDSKTRDAATSGTSVVAQPRTPLPAPPDAQETGVPQTLEHNQLAALKTSAQATATRSNPRLAQTRAAPPIP